MNDIASDLKERFDYASYFFMSVWEHDPDTKVVGNTIVHDKDKEDAEDQLIDTFERLSDSVEDVPQALISNTEELRRIIGREKYEALLIEAIQNVGPNFLPCNATDFLETLNSSLQNSAKAISCDSDRIRLVRS